MKINPRPTCNCRVKTNCPVEGKCHYKKVIYSATVTINPNNIKEYIGGPLAEGLRNAYTNINLLSQAKQNFRNQETPLNLQTTCES